MYANRYSDVQNLPSVDHVLAKIVRIITGANAVYLVEYNPLGNHSAFRLRMAEYISMGLGFLVVIVVCVYVTYLMWFC